MNNNSNLYERAKIASEKAVNDLIKKEFSLDSCSLVVDPEGGSIIVDGYTVNDIKIDDANNLWCKIPTFIPVKYLPIIGKILVEFFENKKLYKGRSWIHLYIRIFQQHSEDLTIDDFVILFRHPKFKGEDGFKEWLVGDSYTTGGHIQYYSFIKTKYSKKELKSILTIPEIKEIADKKYTI